jgi:hypothetical protein
MIPLSADKLSFLEIADHWSRESPASRDKLLAQLEAAWWQGQIAGNSARTRLQFLRIMYQSRHDLQSVVFVTPNDAGPPIETALAGGGFLVDLSPRINVPTEPDGWTEDSCNDAFEKLAHLPSQQYFPRLSHSICFIELTPEEFFGWVIKNGGAAPQFWKRTAETGVTQISPLGSDTPNGFHFPSAGTLSGRSTKTRAIRDAFKALFPNGEIPAGMTSATRNELIFDWFKRNNITPSPHVRTIQRVIKDLIKS